MRSLPLTGILVLIAAAIAAAQQPPFPPAAPGSPVPGAVAPPSREAATDGTARIRGRVVAAATGEPLAGVRVMLSGPMLRMATSDDDGRYEFETIPAGVFSLQATLAPYVAAEFERKGPSGTVRRLTVADGEVVERVDFAMRRGGVITGRVTDEFGEPVVGAEIRIERYQHSPAGRQLATFSTGIPGPFQLTNDLGEYRMFGLAPGAYAVSARVRGRPVSSSAASAADREESFVPTYFPGTANVSEAALINVATAEVAAADFSVVTGRMVQISGTVHDSMGRPAIGLNVLLNVETANSSGPLGPGVPVGPDGSFSMGGVPPGEYVLRVRQPGGGGPGNETASMPLTVGTSNVENLRLTTKPGATIRGRVEWQGSAPRPNEMRVSSSSAIPRVGPLGELTITYVDPLNGLVQEDGTFELGGIVGKVLLRANTGTAWTIKAVLADGEDITDEGADADSLGGDTRVLMVLTDKIAELSGSVRDERGQPVSDYVLMLLPEEPLEGIAATRYTRVARPDGTGTIRVRAVPPGRYVAAALAEADPGDEWDPAVQKRVRAAGRHFTLDEGQTLTLDLELAR